MTNAANSKGSNPIPDPIAAGIAAGWKVIDGASLDGNSTFEADVAIVGTGAGGGVTAEILALAGGAGGRGASCLVWRMLSAFDCEERLAVFDWLAVGDVHCGDSARPARAHRIADAQRLDERQLGQVCALELAHTINDVAPMGNPA